MSGLLGAYLKKIKAEPSEKQCEQFHIFYELLVEWNKVMNLTGITDYEDVIVKHYVDSLAVNCVYHFQKSDKVVDIGTGAGFPGLPLKIMYPDTQFTLIDSLNKRIRFLDEVIEKCGLQKVTTLHGRAEDYAGQKEHREQYDVCVSRAVANLSTLAEYCLPYVKTGGRFIAYKGGNISEELEGAEHAIRLLGGGIEKVENLVLPDTDIQRTFVVVCKTAPTAKKYPRKAGQPGKEPL